MEQTNYDKCAELIGQQDLDNFLDCANKNNPENLDKETMCKQLLFVLTVFKDNEAKLTN